MLYLKNMKYIANNNQFKLQSIVVYLTLKKSISR